MSTLAGFAAHASRLDRGNRYSERGNTRKDTSVLGDLFVGDAWLLVHS